MNNTPRVSLEDTFHLVQLAREAALACGRQEQADALVPVIDQMRALIASERSASRPPSPAIDLAEYDRTTPVFEQLLELNSQVAGIEPSILSGDRNQLVLVLASAGVSNLDIARRLGLTREEVNLIFEAGSKTSINRR